MIWPQIRIVFWVGGLGGEWVCWLGVEWVWWVFVGQGIISYGIEKSYQCLQ